MLYKNKNVKPNNRKKRLLVGAFLVIAAATVSGFLFWNSNNNSQTTDIPDDGSGINYSPATEQEEQSAEANKQEVEKQMNIEKDQPNTSSSQTNLKTVQPIITIAEQSPETNNVEINGYVSGVYEAGGTCTITLAMGSKTVKQSRTALKDAQTTTCGYSEIARSKLASGTWKAKLDYLSKTSRGTSESVTVVVN